MKLWKSIAVCDGPFACTSLSAMAADYKAGDPDAVQSLDPGHPAESKRPAAASLKSSTRARKPTVLLAASDVAGKVELHEMAVTDGVMKMRELENGIDIPAGETVSLKPGGLHIMFMGLNQSFEGRNNCAGRADL